MVLNRRHKSGLFFVLVATGLSLFLEASAKQTAGIVLLGIAAAWFLGSFSPRALGFIACSLALASGIYIAALPVWEERQDYRASTQEYDSAIAAIRRAITEAPVYTTDKKYGLEPATRNAVPASHQPAAKKKPASEATAWDENGNPVSPKPARSIWDEAAADLAKPQKPAASDKEWDYYPAKKNGGKPDGKAPPPPPGFVPEEQARRQRMVQIPEIAQKWERLTPEERDGGWLTVEEPFPGDMSDQDVMREFQTKILLPRPTFSVKATIVSHRLACLGGGSLSFVGLLGCALLIWQVRKTKSQAEPRDRAAESLP